MHVLVPVPVLGIVNMEHRLLLLSELHVAMLLHYSEESPYIAVI